MTEGRKGEGAVTPNPLWLVALVLLDLVVLACVGLFTDPSTVSLMARGLVEWLASAGLDLGDAGRRVVEVAIYALVVVPIGVTLTLWSVSIRRALWALAAGVVAIVVAFAVVTGWLPRSTEVWTALLGVALGVPLGAGSLRRVGGGASPRRPRPAGGLRSDGLSWPDWSWSPSW